MTVSAGGTKVLIVDDEPAIADLVAIFLERGGYQITQKASGWDAFEAVKSDAPALVITDVRMVRGDGIELLEQIQALPRPRPRVALMSGYADVTMPDLLNRGAVAFFTKPLDFSALPASVARLIRPRDETWASAPATGGPVYQRKFASLSAAIAAGDLEIGHGGFFLRAEEPGVPNDTAVEFRFAIGDGAPAEFAGRGVCRWTRLSAMHGFPPGIGVEIQTLTPPTLAWLKDYLDRADPRAFVPVGRRLSR